MTVVEFIISALSKIPVDYFLVFVVSYAAGYVIGAIRARKLACEEFTDILDENILFKMKGKS